MEHSPTKLGKILALPEPFNSHEPKIEWLLLNFNLILTRRLTIWA